MKFVQKSEEKLDLDKINTMYLNLTLKKSDLEITNNNKQFGYIVGKPLHHYFKSRRNSNLCIAMLT